MNESKITSGEAPLKVKENRWYQNKSSSSGITGLRRVDFPPMFMFIAVAERESLQLLVKRERWKS